MNTHKSISCDHCAKKLTYRTDLVVATVFLAVVPYCHNCFVKKIKGMSTLLVDNTPVNGTASNVFSVLALIFLPLLFFIDSPVRWGFIALILLSLGYRAYSYFAYERHLH
ncbi:hypothetical protein LGQ02_15385 [Bacillus shivajii]|uniref:hypothetical protein n=1 Tax=Bacillus shivajii TaxID=1983719 RepID=UPI001CFAA104|nr:hypothetical protein [Bacillus shivajii]UCZ52217.1 hypothetical protein LGQ02_15385 [Bacillus shivajii]